MDCDIDELLGAESTDHEEDEHDMRVMKKAVN